MRTPSTAAGYRLKNRETGLEKPPYPIRPERQYPRSKISSGIDACYGQGAKSLIIAVTARPIKSGDNKSSSRPRLQAVNVNPVTSHHDNAYSRIQMDAGEMAGGIDSHPPPKPQTTATWKRPLFEPKRTAAETAPQPMKMPTNSPPRSSILFIVPQKNIP